MQFIVLLVQLVLSRGVACSYHVFWMKWITLLQNKAGHAQTPATGISGISKHKKAFLALILLMLVKWLNTRVCMKVRASLGALLHVKHHHGHWQITGKCSIAGCCVLLSLGSSVTGHGLLGGRRRQGRGGVTLPMDDDYTRAPAKLAAGPVLLLSSLGIPLLCSQQ